MRITKFLITLIVLLSQGHTASAQFKNILPKPEQISKHVYAWIGPYGGPSVNNKGYRMNLAFVVGKDAVAVLDTGYYPAMAEEMINHIRAITSNPIKYAINTNSQPHRFYGNAAFHKRGIRTYAHAEEINRMKANANNYALMQENVMKFRNVKLPEVAQHAITKPVTFDLGGGVIVKLDFHQGAHTPLPLIINIPADKVVYAGDVLYGDRLLAIVPGGNIKQWIKTYDYMKKYGDSTFIPGHGKPAKLSAFDKPTYSYLVMLDKYMSKAVDDGVEMQDAINRLDQSKFSYLENYTALFGRNANLAYQEAERAAFE